MIYTVKSGEITGGEISLPSSKSISNRLLLINVLCHSPYIPSNLSESDDTKAMLNALESDCSLVDVGAAGTSMRFLTAFLSLSEGHHVITGSERMKNRPIALLVDALRSLGASIEYMEKEGFPPLSIDGRKLKGGTIQLPGNVSSQYISALMMIAPMVDGGLTIELTGKVISKPYIYMTLKTMESFGVKAQWDGNTISIPEGEYTPRAASVESDWSAASYWYSIAALAPGKSFTLCGLHQQSLQGDSQGAAIAANLGVSTTYNAFGVTICADSKPAAHLEYDFNSQPDLAQTFVTLCCLLGTTFKFTGLESLKIKETDRIGALVTEMRKLGYVLSTNDADTIEWHGERCAASDEPIATYKDHRMAMAFAPAALLRGTITIDDPMVVTKSYPRFWDDLKSIGFEVKE